MSEPGRRTAGPAPVTGRRRARQAALCAVALVLGTVLSCTPDPGPPKPSLGWGLTHTQYSADVGDAAALKAARESLSAQSLPQNQHLMGWGADNPEPVEGRYDFEAMDRRIDFVRASGSTPVVTLCCAPDWMKGGEAGVDNVRLLSVDAVWSLSNVILEGGLAELWTFFPDPWPKKKHHKRRLVNPPFAALVASRLQPGGTWRLATDWAEYAEVMAQVLDAEPRLSGGVVPRWAERPVTKFERKGLSAGRMITDLAYRRV